MSARTCGFDSRPRHQVENQVSLDNGGNLIGVHRALVAQWIERSPAKAEVVGSNPAKRAISFVGDDHAYNSSRRCGLESPSANRGLDVFWDRGYSLYAVWKMMPSWRIDQ